MEGFEQRWKDDYDKRQRDDHDRLVEHKGRLDQLDKDFRELNERLNRTREIVNKLSTDRARLIALCTGASAVAGVVIKLFWPTH